MVVNKRKGKKGEDLSFNIRDLNISPNGALQMMLLIIARIIGTNFLKKQSR